MLRSKIAWEYSSTFPLSLYTIFDRWTISIVLLNANLGWETKRFWWEYLFSQHIPLAIGKPETVIVPSPSLFLLFANYLFLVRALYFSRSLYAHTHTSLVRLHRIRSFLIVFSFYPKFIEIGVVLTASDIKSLYFRVKPVNCCVMNRCCFLLKLEHLHCNIYIWSRLIQLTNVIDNASECTIIFYWIRLNVKNSNILFWCELIDFKSCTCAYSAKKTIHRL